MPGRRGIALAIPRSMSFSMHSAGSASAWHAPTPCIVTHTIGISGSGCGGCGGSGSRAGRP
eukprot:1835288-Prorocentrum_lima.AAC.1